MLSLGQLKSLKKVIDERLVNMAMELHDGNIEALPIEGDEYKSICEHCDYRDVCLIEEYDKRKPVLKESFSDIAAVLKDEEGDENG